MGVGVWIRSWGQSLGVWIRSWGQGVGMWIRSWGTVWGYRLDHGAGCRGPD